MNKELAIVMPVYNEEMGIEQVVQDWQKVLPENIFDLVVINDGSKDKTQLVISKLQSKFKNLIIINKINEGHGKAICDGYKYGVKNEYNYIFQTDSDGQFFPSDFSKIWENRDKINCDIILGDRFKRNDPFLRVFLSKVVLRILLKIFFKKSVIDPNIPYRLMSSKFVENFLKIEPQKYIAPNIIMSLHAKSVYFIKVKHAERSYGEVKWPLKKLIKFGFILLRDLKDYFFSIRK